MPFLQPATNNYFGFIPAEGPNARTRIYLVSSSEANQISYGDVVCLATSAGAVSIRRATGSTTTDAGIMVGVAASLVLANGGSTAADIRVVSSQTCLVYDDPNTIFVGCDTTSGVYGQGAYIGETFGVVSTGVVGSTGVNTTINRSVQAISIVTASSGGVPGARFRVIGLHPVETALSTVASGTAAAAAQVRKLLLIPDVHVNRGGIGVAHVTT